MLSFFCDWSISTLKKAICWTREFFIAFHFAINIVEQKSTHTVLHKFTAKTFTKCVVHETSEPKEIAWTCLNLIG